MIGNSKTEMENWDANIEIWKRRLLLNWNLITEFSIECALNLKFNYNDWKLKLKKNEFLNLQNLQNRKERKPPSKSLFPVHSFLPEILSVKRSRSLSRIAPLYILSSLPNYRSCPSVFPDPVTWKSLLGTSTIRMLFECAIHFRNWFTQQLYSNGLIPIFEWDSLLPELPDCWFFLSCIEFTWNFFIWSNSFAQQMCFSRCASASLPLHP